MNLNDEATILNAAGQRSEALDLLRRGITLSRETGLSFLGPWLLGHFALTVEDPLERRAALAEGEEILRNGAVSHNHFWFYRYAIQASLNDGAWNEADRYATALETFARPEPLPWADFFIAWGRALAAHGRDRRDTTAKHDLTRLLDEAQRLNLGTALPMIRHALAVSS